AASDLVPLHHLQLDRVPDLRSGGCVEVAAILPGGGGERTLIHRALRRRLESAAVLAGGGRPREMRLPRSRVVGVRIGAGRLSGAALSAPSALARWLRGRILALRPERDDAERGDDRNSVELTFHGVPP